MTDDRSPMENFLLLKFTSEFSPSPSICEKPLPDIPICVVEGQSSLDQPLLVNSLIKASFFVLTQPIYTNPFD